MFKFKLTLSNLVDQAFLNFNTPKKQKKAAIQFESPKLVNEGVH